MTVTLHTERLVMTPHSRDDFADMVALWGDPAVVRLLGGVPASEEDTWARLQRYVGCWAMFGHGMWAVRARESGTFVGCVGYLEARRSGVAGFDGDPEIGWTIHVAAQGKGFAGEAVRAALDWGASRFGRTVAMINPVNTASVKLAERCGFCHFADGSYKDAPIGLWEYRFR